MYLHHLYCLVSGCARSIKFNSCINYIFSCFITKWETWSYDQSISVFRGFCYDGFHGLESGCYFLTYGYFHFRGPSMNGGNCLRRKSLSLEILKDSICTKAQILITDMTWNLSGLAFLMPYLHPSKPMGSPIFQYGYIGCILLIPPQLDRYEGKTFGCYLLLQSFLRDSFQSFHMQQMVLFFRLRLLGLNLCLILIIFIIVLCRLWLYYIFITRK